MTGGEILSPLLSSPLALALGWTLVHFLWQGLALGLLFVLAERAARNGPAVLRYRLGLAVLGVMALCAVATFALVYDPEPGAAASSGRQTDLALVLGAGPASVRPLLEPLLPWAALAWLLGVLVHGARLTGEVRALGRIKAAGRPLPAPWPEVVDRLRARLGIRRAVRVLESVRVGVPIVVGWIRPVIIVPPSALLGLTPRQLELIICHELAHVARLDYLLNVCQLLIETLFFFHPAVHYVSRRVRWERENCCDDVVVARTGETLAYARALAEVEGLRCAGGWHAAPAATGGHLRGRIARLLLPEDRRGAAGWLIGVAFLAAGAAVLATHFATARSAVLAAVPIARTAAQVRPPADAGAKIVRPAPASLDPGASPLMSAAPAPAPVSAAAPPRADPQPEGAGSAPPPPAAEPAAVPSRQAPPVRDEAGATRETSATMAAPPASTRPEPLPPPTDDEDAAGSSAAAALAAALASALAGPDEAAPASVASSPADGDPVAPAAHPSAPGSSPGQAAAAAVTGGALIKSPLPRYPRRARARGLEGEVTVRYDVNERGRVAGIEVLSARADRLFETSVRRAVRKWRHEPFVLDGRPVTASVTRTFEFGIRGEPVEESALDDDRCRRVTGSRLCRSQDGYEELGVVVVHNPL